MQELIKDGGEEIRRRSTTSNNSTSINDCHGDDESNGVTSATKSGTHYNENADGVFVIQKKISKDRNVKSQNQ